MSGTLRKGSSVQQTPRDAPKLLSLLNSTLSSAHELVRSLSMVQQPSPALTRPIKRNLIALAEGIVALRDEQVVLEQEGRRQKVSLEEVRRKEDELTEVKGAWDRLCEVLKKHEKTEELLVDVKKSHPTLFDSMNTIDHATQPLHPYQDEPYKLANGDVDNDSRHSNADVILSQNDHMAAQDRQLDVLSQSIGRQHHLSVQMNEELDIHASLLDEMDREVDGTGARLGRASRRLDMFTKSLKEHGSTWTIFVLIIVLVLLIAIFK